MNVTGWLQSLAPSPGWLIALILLIALTESLAVIGLVIPGVVLMTAAASLAGHYELSILLILASAAIGAMIGDGVSFVIGHTQRERIPSIWPFRQHPEWLARGARFFQRYGILSVLIGRFVGPVRPIVPMIAGMMHMSPTTFAWSNLGSAILWAPAYVLPGYLLGRTWQQLLSLPPGSDRWLVLLALTVAFLALAFSWLRHELAREGRIYRRLAHFARRRGWRRLWQALRLPYPEGEFPLASLTLLLASLSGLSGWTLFILGRNAPPSMDIQLQTYVDALASPLLTQLAAWVTEASDMLGVTALTLPWASWLLYRRQVAILLHLLGGFGAIALANILFHQLADPTQAGIPEALSYPNAMTSSMVVLSGLAAAYVAETLASRFRALAYWVAILVSLVVALSCLILEIAWLSDLIGGALLGLTVCALARISYHYFLVHPPARTPWPLLNLASLVLVMARIVWLPPA